MFPYLSVTLWGKAVSPGSGWQISWAHKEMFLKTPPFFRNLLSAPSFCSHTAICDSSPHTASWSLILSVGSGTQAPNVSTRQWLFLLFSPFIILLAGIINLVPWEHKEVNNTLLPVGGCQSQMIRVHLDAQEMLLIGHRGSEVPCMTNGCTRIDGPQMLSWVVSAFKHDSSHLHVIKVKLGTGNKLKLSSWCGNCSFASTSQMPGSIMNPKTFKWLFGGVGSPSEGTGRKA